MTPGAVAKKIRTLPEFMRIERMNALRRIVGRSRKAAVTLLTSRGIGRALWGQNPKGARLSLKTVGVKFFGAGSMRGGIVAKGIAAMVEDGGQTKAHVIKPKRAGALKLNVGSGLVIRDQVNHLGSKIPRQPFLVAVVDVAQNELPQELDIGHRKAIEKAGLQ